MKIRNGFISNSSSSSFIIVGVMHGNKDFYKILNELNIDSDSISRNFEPPHGFVHGDHGQYESTNDKLILIDSEDGIYGIGISAIEFLNSDLKVSEIAEVLSEKLKKRGVDTTSSMFKLYYGTSGW